MLLSDHLKQRAQVRIKPERLDNRQLSKLAKGRSHHGYKAAHRATGASTDRVIGPQTLAAAMAADLVNLINRAAMYHEQFYRSLSTFETFERGWIKREDQTRKQAIDMG